MKFSEFSKPFEKSSNFWCSDKGISGLWPVNPSRTTWPNVSDRLYIIPSLNFDGRSSPFPNQTTDFISCFLFQTLPANTITSTQILQKLMQEKYRTFKINEKSNLIGENRFKDKLINYYGNMLWRCQGQGTCARHGTCLRQVVISYEHHRNNTPSLTFNTIL